MERPDVTQALSDAVRRALTRDTMLRLAHDAEQALVIVRKDDHRARVYETEEELLRTAVERYLVEAQTRRRWTGQADRDWSFRKNGHANAATILRFCAFLGHPLPSTPDIDALYEKALDELTGYGQLHRAELAAATNPSFPMSESNYNQFVKEAGDFKRAAKEFWRCLQDAPAKAKTPSGKIDMDKLGNCSNGVASWKTGDEVIKQYNEFIRTSNAHQFP